MVVTSIHSKRYARMPVCQYGMLRVPVPVQPLVLRIDCYFNLFFSSWGYTVSRGEPIARAHRRERLAIRSLGASGQ